MCKCCARPEAELFINALWTLGPVHTLLGLVQLNCASAFGHCLKNRTLSTKFGHAGKPFNLKPSNETPSIKTEVNCKN